MVAQRSIQPLITWKVCDNTTLLDCGGSEDSSVMCAAWNSYFHVFHGCVSHLVQILYFAYAPEFWPMGKKAAMPLAEIIATCRKNVSNTGPWYQRMRILTVIHKKYMLAFVYGMPSKEHTKWMLCLWSYDINTGGEIWNCVNWNVV